MLSLAGLRLSSLPSKHAPRRFRLPHPAPPLRAPTHRRDQRRRFVEDDGGAARAGRRPRVSEHAREAPRTYEFLDELAAALGRRKPIVWLEYQPPKRRGARPCESRFAIVDSKTADRSGGPFEMLMVAINAFRASKGRGPIAPWFRSRLCTAYLKTRVARSYAASLGWTEWDEIVGLRADEPDRVARLRSGVPGRIGRLAPLADAGITKADVDRFWDRQTFALRLPSLMGNCTGCFLKDQSDLARALAEPASDADWWISMEKRWPNFGGTTFAGYSRLRAEAPERTEIETALRTGAAPVRAKRSRMTPERFRLVVIQERKRLAGQVAPFACECEGSTALASLDEDEEDEMILHLPSEEDSADSRAPSRVSSRAPMKAPTKVPTKAPRPASKDRKQLHVSPETHAAIVAAQERLNANEDGAWYSIDSVIRKACGTLAKG